MTTDLRFGRFTDLDAFVHAVHTGCVWMDMLMVKLQHHPATIWQWGVHLTAFDSAASPRPPIFFCTFLAAALESVGRQGTLVYPHTEKASIARCQALQQQLAHSLVAYLEQSSQVAQIVTGACWIVPAPWSQLAHGFVYDGTQWVKEPEKKMIASSPS